MCYGPEFFSKALDRWACENGVTLDFSRPGRLTDNAFVASFNGRLRDEGVNIPLVPVVGGCQGQDRAWRRDDNESRPHTSLGGAAQGSGDAQHRWKGGGGWLTPIEYAASAAIKAAE
jgi:putative transposase